MAHSIIPVEYVTKWAKTKGILVVSDAEMYTSGSAKNYLTNRFGLFVPSRHWTTDKAVAEERWRQAVAKEAARLKAAAKKYEALSKGAPVYAEEEG